LTVIIKPSEGAYVASCFELYLATEGNTPETVLDDLINMAIDYAGHYLKEFELLATARNVTFFAKAFLFLFFPTLT
jgi:hypothetical protein